MNPVRKRHAGFLLIYLAAPVHCLLTPHQPRGTPIQSTTRSVVCHAFPGNIDAFPELLAAAGVVVVGSAWWMSGAQDRAKNAQYTEWEEQDRQRREERERRAYIAPKDGWTEQELQQYDGTDPDGPILMAVSGDVFNVWKGRNFYAEGGEYHALAGRDATRLLAKTKLEEETPEELDKPLSIAEKAALEAWYWTIKNKYDYVGKLDNGSD